MSFIGASFFFGADAFDANDVDAFIDEAFVDAVADAFIASPLASATGFASRLFLRCALNDPPMQAIAVVVVNGVKV